MALRCRADLDASARYELMLLRQCNADIHVAAKHHARLLGDPHQAVAGEASLSTDTLGKPTRRLMASLTDSSQYLFCQPYTHRRYGTEGRVTGTWWSGMRCQAAGPTYDAAHRELLLCHQALRQSAAYETCRPQGPRAPESSCPGCVLEPQPRLRCRPLAGRHVR